MLQEQGRASTLGVVQAVTQLVHFTQLPCLLFFPKMSQKSKSQDRMSLHSEFCSFKVVLRSSLADVITVYTENRLAFILDTKHFLNYFF